MKLRLKVDPNSKGFITSMDVASHRVSSCLCRMCSQAHPNRPSRNLGSHPARLLFLRQCSGSRSQYQSPMHGSRIKYSRVRGPSLLTRPSSSDMPLHFSSHMSFRIPGSRDPQSDIFISGWFLVLLGLVPGHLFLSHKDRPLGLSDIPILIARFTFHISTSALSMALFI